MNDHSEIPLKPLSNLGADRPKRLTPSEQKRGKQDGFGFDAFITVRRGHIIMLAIGALLFGLSLGWCLAAAAFRYRLLN